MSLVEDDVAPSMEELLERFRHATQEELHTALPGRVEAYYATSSPGHAGGTIDVTPMVKRRIPRRDGSLVSEAMPTLRSVRVVWPSAGQWFLRFPLAAGDEVLLVMCERDISQWLQTGQLSDPPDVRAHHLAHAIAIPGLRSRPGALPAPTGTAFELGKADGSTIRVNADGTIQLGGPATAQFVALANLVGSELSSIASTLAAMNTQIGVAGGGSTPAYVPGSVAAAKVKAE